MQTRHQKTLAAIQLAASRARPGNPAHQTSFELGALWAGGKFGIEEVAREFNKWADETLTEITSQSQLTKLQTELDELYAAEFAPDVSDVKVREELVDVLMVLLHHAHKLGFSFNDIVMTMSSKLSINRARKWKLLPNKTYQHE